MATSPFFDVIPDLERLEEEAKTLTLQLDDILENGWPVDFLRHHERLNSMASSIEKCYSGVEKLLKNIISSLDGDIPNSKDWEKQVITRAAHHGANGRPAFIDKYTATLLDQLRVFRHRERDSYSALLNEETILENTNKTILMIKQIRNIIEKEGITQTDIEEDYSISAHYGNRSISLVRNSDEHRIDIPSNEWVALCIAHDCAYMIQTFEDQWSDMPRLANLIPGLKNGFIKEKVLCYFSMFTDRSLTITDLQHLPKTKAMFASLQVHEHEADQMQNQLSSSNNEERRYRP